jgi:cell wall-associated NlpC family hydrolase
VQACQCVPPIPETVAYVQRVFATAAQMAASTTLELPGGERLRRVIAFAVGELGSPYRWGAEGPDAYDCSGFTQAAYRAGGVDLPRTSRQQYLASPHVRAGDLQLGDLLFWAHDTADPASIHHVAIYLGDGRMVDAPHTGAYVQIRPVYWTGYIGATRPLAGLL